MSPRLSLLTLIGLSACAPVVIPVPVPLPQPKPPQVELIGREPQEVIALLGPPTLDRAEGPARQLQFARDVCVLDIFFYPDRKTSRAAATHIEARTRMGQTFDAKACVEALAARG